MVDSSPIMDQGQILEGMICPPASNPGAKDLTMSLVLLFSPFFFHEKCYRK